MLFIFSPPIDDDNDEEDEEESVKERRLGVIGGEDRAYPILRDGDSNSILSSGDDDKSSSFTEDDEEEAFESLSLIPIPSESDSSSSSPHQLPSGDVVLPEMLTCGVVKLENSYMIALKMLTQCRR